VLCRLFVSQGYKIDSFAAPIFLPLHTLLTEQYKLTLGFIRLFILFEETDSSPSHTTQFENQTLQVLMMSALPTMLSDAGRRSSSSSRRALTHGRGGAGKVVSYFDGGGNWLMSSFFNR
jgi:hypothetical protein